VEGLRTLRHLHAAAGLRCDIQTSQAIYMIVGLGEAAGRERTVRNVWCVSTWLHWLLEYEDPTMGTPHVVLQVPSW